MSGASGLTTRLLAASATALLAGLFACASAPPNPHAGSGLARGIAAADSLIDAAVGTQIPGAVLVVSRDGRIVHERSDDLPVGY